LNIASVGQRFQVQRSRIYTVAVVSNIKISNRVNGHPLGRKKPGADSALNVIAVFQGFFVDSVTTGICNVEVAGPIDSEPAGKDVAGVQSLETPDASGKSPG